MTAPVKNSTPLPYQVSQELIGFTGVLVGEGNRSHEKYAFSTDTTRRQEKNRWDKFTNTFSSGIEIGAQSGAILGSGVMFVPDCILGKGNTQSLAKYNPEAEGLVGLVAHAAIDTVSTATMIPGAVAGGALGLLVEPMSSDKIGQTTNDGIIGGANLASTTTSAMLSAPVGIALSAARLPSLIVKGATTVVGGIVGGVIGFVGGLGRLLFNL